MGTWLSSTPKTSQSSHVEEVVTALDIAPVAGATLDIAAAVLRWMRWILWLLRMWFLLRWILLLLNDHEHTAISQNNQHGLYFRLSLLCYHW